MNCQECHQDITDATWIEIIVERVSAGSCRSTRVISSASIHENCYKQLAERVPA